MLDTCGSYSNFASDSPFQFPFLWKLGKFPPCHFTEPQLGGRRGPHRTRHSGRKPPQPRRLTRSEAGAQWVCQGTWPAKPQPGTPDKPHEPLQTPRPEGQQK